jgi:penicillin-binding protein 2
MFSRRSRSRIVREIAPEEIFLDSSNLPGHDTRQFEGRVERPVARQAIIGVGFVFVAIALVFGGRAFLLQVLQGTNFATISQENTLQRTILFATRGVIYDRAGHELAWNVPQPDATSTVSSTYALRQYTPMPGLSLLLGFVSYPQQDRSGTWWREQYAGVSGIESSFDAELNGVNGSTMVETDARGRVQRQDLIAPPQEGANLTLSIDGAVQSELYSALVSGARVDGFQGGAGIIMDARTGELLAITSFPEYDHQAFQQGDRAAVAAAARSPYSPMLDRAISGLYAPGSIVKPIFAAGALDSGIISPDTQILSTGKLVVPNPYDPAHPSVFNDWAVHGLIDMKTAIAVSSDEYFYTIAGGFGGQKGLGISGLDKYAAMFGLGTTTGIALAGEQGGVIPSPEWKLKVFGKNDPWLLGDTYHTGIGQFGFQITPLQAVRFAAALGNGGKLLLPKLLASSTPEFTQLSIPQNDLAVVREGMRLAVTSSRKDATVKEFFISGIDLAAKTGTAQVGARNQWVNSWVIGFWPADNPKYAFVAMLERGPASETFNAASSMVPFFQWLVANHPEYVN